MLNKITVNQYFTKFWELLKDQKNRDKSQEQLYNELEAWHYKKTGQNKCKTYQSFRVMKTMWYKSNRT